MVCVSVFIFSFQSDLDETAETWNRHNIRPSGNDSVPFGRPDVMFYALELWQAQDSLHSVQDVELNVCYQEALFRSSTPCDEDIDQMSVGIMRRDNFDPPKNFSEAIQLYLHLRSEILYEYQRSRSFIYLGHIIRKVINQSD